MRPDAMKPWYASPELVSQLPLRLKAYALYCRLFARPAEGRIPGGSFLLRRLIGLTRLLRLRSWTRLEVGGEAVYLNLCDPRMFWVIAEVGEVSAEGRVIDAELDPGDTFLDIGANHGAMAIRAARRVGEEGMVIAAEPQPDLAKLVGRSLAEGPAGLHRVLQVALGDREGEIDLFVPEGHSGSAGIFRSYSAQQAHRRHRVRLARFDDLVSPEELPGRVFLKLDIEGSELAFLRGAQKLLRQTRPRILLELNPESAAASGSSVEELLEALEALGYRRFAPVESYPEAVAAADLDHQRQQNVVALPDDPL